MPLSVVIMDDSRGPAEGRPGRRLLGLEGKTGGELTIMRLGRLWPLVYLISLGPAAAAPASSTGLAVTVDSDQLRHLDWDLSWGATDDARVTLGAGTTRDDQAGDYSAHYVSAGLSSDALKPIGAQVAGSYWWQPDAASITTLEAGPSWSSAAWSVAVTGELRRITLEGTAMRHMGTRATDINASAVALDLSYFGVPRWGFSAGGYAAGYSDNLDTLASARFAGRVFSQATLDVARGLDDHRLYGEAVYYRGPWSLGLNVTRGLTAAEQSRYDRFNVRLGWEVSLHWSMAAHGGAITPEVGNDTVYAGLSARYYW